LSSWVFAYPILRSHAASFSDCSTLLLENLLEFLHQMSLWRRSGFILSTFIQEISAASI
jgi:hypothetical protein